MNWYSKLYVGKKAEKKKEKIRKEIDREIYKGNTYLITLSSNPKNNLEIFSVQELRFPYLREHCPMIVGIALGWEEALEVLQEMVKEVYYSTGEANLREYFLI